MLRLDSEDFRRVVPNPSKLVLNEVMINASIYKMIYYCTFNRKREWFVPKLKVQRVSFSGCCEANKI